MKKAKILLSLFLSVVLILSLTVYAVCGGKTVITSPYDGIDWDSVSLYKAALHTHTNASDGKASLVESLARHNEAGFDIVAVTDHGTVNRTWLKNDTSDLVYGALRLAGKSKGELCHLEKSGTFPDGTRYEYVTENGDDYLITENGGKILRLPYAIENNAVSVNAHVNGFFADYHDNTVTMYEDAVFGVDRAGGVSVINHPGEYTKARYELYTRDAYDTYDFSYNYYINKYAHLIDKYDSCIGIDINSKKDVRTKYERKLWDELLSRFSAKGKNVYAIASSDAHSLDIIDTGFTYLIMTENTSKNARVAMENGCMLPASHCIGNRDELFETAKSIKELYGETKLYDELMTAVYAIDKEVSDIENGNKSADSAVNNIYSVIDSNGYFIKNTEPKVKRIDTQGSTLKIETENAVVVRFISDGKAFLTVKPEDACIDLSAYGDALGDYVRAEIFGEGGIIYTEPFLINAEEKDSTHSVINGFYINGGVLDFLFAEIRNLFEITERFFSNLF